MVITVLYSCHECGLERVPVGVPARDHEEVMDWMRQTFRLVSADHRRRSPTCHPVTLSDLSIPIEGTDRIGGPTQH